MASIRKRRNKYFSRVVWRNEDGTQLEKQIPLQTDKKSIAVVRNNEVSKVEDTLRSGENWSFPWMNQDGKVKLIRLSISEAYEEYRNVQNIDGVRASTLDRVDHSMKTLYKVFGENYPIASITYSHIEQYKEYWHGTHQPTTMNINLSKIRAFHNWCVKKNYTKKVEFVKVREDEKPPQYLTDEEFKSIMQCDIIDDHFKKAFVFYLYTGCRKTEPFIADLNGKWLTIKSTDAKSHKTRDIELNEVTKGIVQEMRDRYHYYMDEYG